MTTIVTRAGKGSPLTNDEVDSNFTNLNTAKIETLTSTDTSVTITGTGSSRDLSVPINPDVVSGPASATDNAIARYDLTTGKLIQNSLVIIDDSGNVSGVSTLTATNLTVNDDTTLGGSNADTLAVNARITTDLEPNANNAKDIGTNGRNWRDGFFGRTVHTVNLELTGTTSFDGSQGTSGQVLTSAGTGNTPTWTTPTTATITDDTTTDATRYPLFEDVTSGSLTSVNVSSTKYTFNPSTGTLSATVMTASSDERLKENWTDVAPDFIEKLAQVKHGVFSRKDNGSREAGAGAQSFMAVLPEAVISDEKGYLSLNYGGAALVAAIELAKVVEELRAEIAMLKAKVGG